ncbi:MAG: cobalamin B12-binding domain-containing protein [Deltaproteobacteria bacterium]|nr:cobalamin B12-binding domain-containing protein [Deltaproteobacteria bacterium]
MQDPSFSEMRQSIVDGDVEVAERIAREVVASGTDLLPAIDEGFAAGIREVGRLWEEGEYFLPELVQSAVAMKAAMAIVQPALAARRGPREPLGRVVIGTVQGDLHDIGKTLVGTLLGAHGFEVHDLGADVPVETFLSRAREVKADIVAASALLTTTMVVQDTLARALSSGTAKLLVGGAPTTPQWAKQIGAAHAENAMSAVAAARALVEAPAGS